MSTNKPRIQAYIESALYEQFEQERSTWELSQSQAIEKILSDRYGDGSKPEIKDTYTESFVLIQRQLDNLDFRVKSIELQTELLSELDSEVQSKLLSELQIKLQRDLLSKSSSNLLNQAPSELDSSLPSELSSELDSSLPSELSSELDSSLPSELDSELDSSLPSELDSELDSSLPSELDSELDSSLPSELDSELDSSLPSELELSKGLSQRALAKRLGCSHPYIKDLEVLGHLATFSQREDPQGLAWELRGKKYYPTGKPIEASSKAQEEAETFIVYEFDSETNQYRYWSGGYRMFDTSLHLACKYKSEETANRSMSAIAANPKYIWEQDKHQAGRFSIGVETLEFLAKNKNHLLKR